MSKILHIWQSVKVIQRTLSNPSCRFFVVRVKSNLKFKFRKWKRKMRRMSFLIWKWSWFLSWQTPNGYPHLEHKKKRLVKPCFKSLKQHLKIKVYRILEHAVQMQISTTITTYCLVTVIQFNMQQNRSSYKVL